ncbi:site-specific integrase [Roseomonas sp. 18066]|uniref:tyrosine-type recombinase/integrase n=1 Tax=Roseomonas sp. 18066 TaxID=2681412 RepID=UPI00135BD9D5|nr:site-specific integrase [Roseomonas sp. 18066]
MAKLTALALKAKLVTIGKEVQTSPIRIGDERGLHLLVKANQVGAGSWVLRYTFAGKRKDMGLGAYPGVSLAEARETVEKAHQQIRRGEDPMAHRQASKQALIEAARQPAEKLITFRDACLATVEAKRGGWSNPKHAAQWMATLEQHAFPVIGGRPVAEIDLAAVLQVLHPIWPKIPETASRLRQRIEATLDLARVRGWREGDNPARWRGLLSEELPPPRRVQRVAHRPALPWQEMPHFWAALCTVDGMGAKALRFSILTAARTGEVRGMRWREVDLAAGVWSVPALRMKARRLHRVPLSDAACRLLHELQPFARSGDDLVFPSARSASPLSDMTISAVIRRMNEDAGTSAASLPRWRDHEGRAIVPHGLRSTFRDWAGETREEGREVVERALAHTIKDKVEAAYARSDLLEKRRALMQAWAFWCTDAVTP